MGLIINQGKQDSSQDNKFDAIVEQNVLAQIVSVKLADKQVDTLEVKFKILSGKHKNRLFFDRVNYNPTSRFAWRYRALRKSAGCPYSDAEGTSIDIEAMLLNKAVTVDLSAREGTNSKGEKQTYQNVNYKAPSAESKAASVAATPVADDDGSDSPFGADDSGIPDDDDWGIS